MHTHTHHKHKHMFILCFFVQVITTGPLFPLVLLDICIHNQHMHTHPHMHMHTHSCTHTSHALITNMCICTHKNDTGSHQSIYTHTYTHTNTTGLCFVNLGLNYYLGSLLSLIAMCTFRCTPELQVCTHSCTHTHTQTHKNTHIHTSKNHPLLLTPFCLVLHSDSHLYLQHYSLLVFNLGNRKYESSCNSK